MCRRHSKRWPKPAKPSRSRPVQPTPIDTRIGVPTGPRQALLVPSRTSYVAAARRERNVSVDSWPGSQGLKIRNAYKSTAVSCGNTVSRGLAGTLVGLDPGLPRSLSFPPRPDPPRSPATRRGEQTLDETEHPRWAVLEAFAMRPRNDRCGFSSRGRAPRSRDTANPSPRPHGSEPPDHLPIGKAHLVGIPLSPQQRFTTMWPVDRSRPCSGVGESSRWR